MQATIDLFLTTTSTNVFFVHVSQLLLWAYINISYTSDFPLVIYTSICFRVIIFAEMMNIAALTHI